MKLFELSIAGKYLIPKGKQLTLSLISCLSIGVIALVVWLILVFLSVTEGMEKGWLERLTALHSPLQITPTSEYYRSYYYQIDSYAEASSFAYKTIGEKEASSLTDPYDPESDAELPPSLVKKNEHKDLVKLAYASLRELKERQPDLAFQDFEVTGALLRLKLLRKDAQSTLSQMSYVATYSSASPTLPSLLIEPKVTSLAQQEVLLPKGYFDSGVRIGDRGFLSYIAPTASSTQELRTPIIVKGFYDPGIMAVGSKCLFASFETVHAIFSANQGSSTDPSLSNGIQVWFKDLGRANEIKASLQQEFEKRGIAKYWKIAAFKEYDFAKDLMQQFQSDRYLFTLVGIIILLVACCNIISLLIILVNDKKKEVGILLSMGASTKSIIAIFALSGVVMGTIGALVGAFAAYFTMHNIQTITRLLSHLQGHQAFNTAFYGVSLPNQLSESALLFIAIATPLLSLIAGLIPASKAARLKPSELLRNE